MDNLPSDIQELDLRIRNMKNKSETAESKGRSRLRKFCEYAFRMAMEFAAPVVVALCIGFVADKFFKTTPVIMLILAIFGIAAGTLNLYRAAQQIDKEMKKE